MDIDVSGTTIACAIYLAQVVIPSLLLVLTPKRSSLRYLWMLCSVWIAYRLFLMSEDFSGSLLRFTHGSIMVFVTVIHTVNLLHLNPLDKVDLFRQRVTASDRLLPSIHGSVRLLFTLRGLNTPWQVKGVPSQPAFLTNKGDSSISRGRYFLRQFLFLAWQYLAMDVLYVLSVRKAASKVESAGASAPMSWSSRIYLTALSWFVVARLLIDSFYRFAALIAVGMGDCPGNWPPLIGSMGDAYTVRYFWGKFWHQLMRWPLTSVSNFLARDIFRLRHPSLLERYINLTLVFLLSGILHLASDYMQGVPPHKSSSLVFFLGSALGIMIEDAVQAMYRNVTGASSSESRTGEVPPLWKRLVGFIWVVAWLSVLSPGYLLASKDLPKENRWYVPVSIANHIGLAPAVKVVMAGGAILVFAFGAVL